MWKVEYTKRFYKDMAVLPKAVQERIEPIVFEQLETDNPFELGNEDLIRSIICGLGILPGIKQPRRLFHII
jgi:mRNA-degrading endonuclease RelE of RelBE toxin-antitoxin system